MRTQRNVHFFYPSGDVALSVFGEDRRLLEVFLCAILDHFVQWPVHDSLVQEAVKMVTSPSHWLTLQTFIALCPSSNLECISWRVEPTCLANTCCYQYTHTHTLSLSLSVSMQRGMCAYESSVSETESLVGMNSCRFGV